MELWQIIWWLTININEYSPLALAYLGDSVFEIMVREKLIKQSNVKVDKLNIEARKYVSAVSQSKMYLFVFDKLSIEEQNTLKWGKNAKIKTASKSSTLLEYKNATGLETLFGYLYLLDKKDRLNQIFDMCYMSIID